VVLPPSLWDPAAELAPVDLVLPVDVTAVVPEPAVAEVAARSGMAVCWTSY
jgi:hypothetical protein